MASATVTITVERYERNSPPRCVVQRDAGDLAVGKFTERWPIREGDYVAHVGGFAIDVYRQREFSPVSGS